jgi:hypothetical protein
LSLVSYRPGPSRRGRLLSVVTGSAHVDTWFSLSGASTASAASCTRREQQKRRVHLSAPLFERVCLWLPLPQSPASFHLPPTI